jgi:hypothetical protein
MGESASITEFKSPRHKLVAFFHWARDQWRERAHKYYRQMRSLEVKARDLERSRDGWRQKYQRERERRLELERPLSSKRRQAPGFSKLVTAGARPPA